MTSTHRYRYALLGLALLGLFVAVLLPRHSSTEVATVDEPTTTTAYVPPTTTTTTVPETTTVATTVAPPATVVVEPTTVVPVVPVTEAVAPAAAEPEASAAVVADAIPADEQPAPAERVQTTCVSDPDYCNPPPDPVYRQPGPNASCPQWWETAQAAGWPADAMDTLDYVMRRESGCDQYARNPSGATGLVQLMPMHWRGKFDPYDPFLNLHKGYELWTGSGWAPWEVCGFRRGC